MIYAAYQGNQAWVSLPLRRCDSASAHPSFMLLTLRSSSSDEPIIFNLAFNLALVLFLSTLDDDARCPVWDPGKPKREPSETIYVELKSAPTSPSRSPTPCRFKHSHLASRVSDG